MCKNMSKTWQKHLTCENCILYLTLNSAHGEYFVHFSPGLGCRYSVVLQSTSDMALLVMSALCEAQKSEYRCVSLRHTVNRDHTSTALTDKEVRRTWNNQQWSHLLKHSESWLIPRQRNILCTLRCELDRLHLWSAVVYHKKIMQMMHFKAEMWSLCFC